MKIPCITLLVHLSIYYLISTWFLDDYFSADVDTYIIMPITYCSVLNPQSCSLHFILCFLNSYFGLLVTAAECVGLLSIPQGAWYCKYCQNMFEKEKFAELNANAIAAGRVPGVNPLEDITKRCIRIVANVEKYIGGGCVICRLSIYSFFLYTICI